ncbi:hypothetical protein M405DRAFT_929909 [Rhizopogon salebrosus TDB-379]|nr:hypothetical protein M405DRAFT_929909 [Rhizopogon salebrosus TDB-379]
MLTISLAWTPDGTRLLSCGHKSNQNMLEWDTLTWKQVGVHWRGHTDLVEAIAINPAGTLVASASVDNHMRLWRPSDRRTIAIFKDIDELYCVTFSADGKYILSGCRQGLIKEWATHVCIDSASFRHLTLHKDTFLVEPPEEQAKTKRTSFGDASGEQATTKHTLSEDVPEKRATNDAQAHFVRGWSRETGDIRGDFPFMSLFEDASEDLMAKKRRSVEFSSHPNILDISTTAFNACITGDLAMAEDLLTQEIDSDADNYNSYANRSFVMARKLDWDSALHDALKSVNIQPSLTGYLSKGIALCGQMKFQDATKAFALAFMFAEGGSKTVHLLLLIKVIALFNANQHDEAMLRVQELATACPTADIVACRAVEACLRVQLGINALDNDEAAAHFTTAVKSCLFSSKSDIDSTYEVFVVLFGLDLKYLWKIANQKRCDALLRAGRITEALESYRYMMDMSDEVTEASCLGWSTGFKQECRALYITRGDAAFATRNYDMAIELYSEAIDLDSATDAIFAKRSKAKLENMLWEDALLDAQKVIELNPSSSLGYQLKHAALYGIQRCDEANEAYQIMLSKLDKTPVTQAQDPPQRHVSPSEAERAVRKVVDAQLENTPPRLLNTITGRLCDREAQISTFKTTTEYMELLSSIIERADLGNEHVVGVVAMHFRYAMLSHRWSGKEPLLQEVQDKVVYELDSSGNVMKLQSFCKTARYTGYRWAWSDTCCIDKNNNIEVQESVNTMFVWYSHSALTIVYLSDVMPSSKAGALARSAWTRRGWTVQEFLAPEIVLFYQKDWTLYLDDRSPNHKASAAIMQELGGATGINARALVAFRPGMKDAREKLQWASMRVTTLQEDMAYSLFGIFGVHLPVIYGERKQSALGRLLQEVVARSGDISALDWVGKPSDFNSCLPADISSYKPLPSMLPRLSENQIQISISSLRHVVAMDLALRLYDSLENMNAPRFANCRLHLPCLVFPVTEVKLGRVRDQKVTHELKANGLNDLTIVTDDELSNRETLLLVYPWNHDLLKQLNPVDDTQNMGNCNIPSGSRASRFIGRVRQLIAPINSESHLRALQLIVRLGQPFRAFLLAQWRAGEYRRIATDHDIITQVRDTTFVRKMNVRVVEIL